MENHGDEKENNIQWSDESVIYNYLFSNKVVYYSVIFLSINIFKYIDMRYWV